jgi:iron complex outermembrane receptor protein
MEGVEMTIRKSHGALAASSLACMVGSLLPMNWAHAQAAKPAAAGGELEEVVVTAERRTNDVQSTASSVTVVTGTELKEQGKFTLQQILADVPGLDPLTPTPGAQSGSDQSGNNITIRGIRSNTGGATAATSVAAAAAVYVDGVFEGIGGGYDIDRIEVLRGPQGTLYGRSATSGLVAIHTADPKLDKLEGSAGVEYGNYQLRRYNGAVSLPLVDDKLAVRVSANRYQREGYNNELGGGPQTSTDARVKLLFKPVQGVSLLVGAALQNNVTSSGGTTIVLNSPNTYQFNPTPVGHGNNDLRQYWGELNWDLGVATLTWQPAVRTYESSSTAFVRSGLALDQTTVVPRDRFHTEELRLASNPGSKLVWQVGAFYYNNSMASSNTVHIVPPSPPFLVGLAFDSQLKDKTTTATSVFGEFTYPVADRWRITGGVRYDDTKVSVTQDYTSALLITGHLFGDAGKREFKNTTFRARVEHDLAERHMVYASISSGASPGDISIATDATNHPIALELKAETLVAYEIGSKNRFLDNRLQANASLYFYDYGGYQTVINITPAGLPTNTGVAVPAQVAGGELETIWQVTPADRINFDVAVTNSYLVKKDTSLGVGSATIADFFVGNGMPGVTPFSTNFAYDHEFLLSGGSRLTLRGAARYASPHNLTNLTALQATQVVTVNGRPFTYYQFFRVDGQVVGEMNLAWNSANSKWSANAYVRNIGSNRYKTGVNVQGPGVNFIPSIYEPRTVGINVNARF